MEENKTDKEISINDKLKDLTEKSIEKTIKEGITTANLDLLGKLVDIHKDISEEDYWKRKEINNMNYGNYGNYGNYSGRGPGHGSYGENYGRGGYGEYGNYGEYGEGYGRRGYDMKYRGGQEMDRMAGEYGRYQESRERYGAGQETDKSFHYMVKALEDFIKVLYEEAEGQQQKQQLRQALQNSMM